ncbi:MAG: hypothetical protein GC153_02655 [Alphaproteobacteria bacterium]|nr:hypothetical protein [Alphaproteobacteria bacterium]
MQRRDLCLRRAAAAALRHTAAAGRNGGLDRRILELDPARVRLGDGFWRHNPPHNKRWRPGEWRQSKRGWYWDAGTLALILARQLFFLRPKAPNF